MDDIDKHQEALSVAAELAEQFDARVHLLFVKKPTQVINLHGFTPMVSKGHTSQEVRQWLQDADESFPSDQVEPWLHIEEGFPAQVILDCIESIDIDLVIMGSHGHSGIDRLLMGSVAEEVCRQADVPVLITPMSKS